jgi:peptidyl-prolyl cis-trans isomerase D
MATLEKIRNKAGVLIAAVIGLALLAFILGDLFDSRKSVFFSNNNNIAEIGGKSIPMETLDKKIKEITEIYKMNGQNPDESMTDNIREQAWQQLVNENIMNKEYDGLGLTVSPDELSDQILGQHPNNIVKQLFTDPKTGQTNRTLLLQFLKSTTENPTSEQMKFRLYMETEIRNERISSKYNTLVRKGLQAPSFIAKNELNENGRKVDFNFIVQHYNVIPDKDITVSASDLKDYYGDHKYLYDQTASRDIEYVSFDVLPSKDDRIAAKEWIDKIKPDFTTTTEVEQFVTGNSDVAYNNKNFKPKDLSDSLSNFMFNAKIGEVYGPYFDNGSFKIARLYKVVDIADSVKARHILVAPKGQTKADMENAKSKADSIKKLLDGKADFAALAKQFSDDKGSAEKGGELGWFQEGAMVPQFNDAAFEAKKNEIRVVETRYGYHIIQVLEKGKESKKVKVAIIERKLEPSQRTFDATYSAAMKFASENTNYAKFSATADKQRLAKKIATNLGDNDKAIPGLEQARPVIKWAYQAKKSQISEPITIGEHFIVAALVEVREKGIAPLEQVKNEVELQVRKQKKAEKISENIQKLGARTIQDLALKAKTSVETASNISFSSYALPSAGIEPKLIALATSIGRNTLSAPIDGNNGVYVVFVNNAVAPVATDLNDIKMRLSYNYQSRASSDCFAALRKLANIVDKRSKFY